MKMFAIVTLALFVSASAHAQYSSRNTVKSTSDYSSPSGNAVTGYLGFGSGALNIGGGFESSMTSDTGIGGYFMVWTEKKDAGRPQVITFGGDVKVHYRTGGFDFYGAPGFGIALIDTPADDETTFGPSMRIGVLYSFTPTVAVGIEHMTVFNWFSDKMVESAETANAAVRFNF